MPTTIPLSSCVSTTCVYNSHSRIPSQGIELVCSLAECGTDQTSRWYGSNIETNKPVCITCYKLQLVPADRVCGAACCGKGVSVVKDWRHSQRDKDNKDMWFCKSCSDKEVGIPQFPPLNLDVPSRTVSLNASTFHFLFFRSRCNSRRKRGGRA